MTVYLVSGGIAFAAAMLGGLATDIGDWYRGLTKPSWQPPDWLFAPVWTLIFALIAWSAGAAWLAATPEVRGVQVVLPFAVNLLLNVAWSFLFFRLRRPRLAFVELLALWLSIVVMIAALWPISELAALLLLPYLIWVSFAGWLNRTIVRLNPEVR
ncbi:MAG: TspO/MBR family protein [Pseudomonadales bacterium]